jgi:hypothetical protein
VPKRARRESDLYVHRQKLINDIEHKEITRIYPPLLRSHLSRGSAEGAPINDE